MADRDPFIIRRLADERAATLLAAADRHRSVVGRRLGWRQAAGLALVRLGEVLLGERGETAQLLGAAGAAR